MKTFFEHFKKKRIKLFFLYRGCCSCFIKKPLEKIMNVTNRFYWEQIRLFFIQPYFLFIQTNISNRFRKFRLDWWKLHQWSELRTSLFYFYLR